MKPTSLMGTLGNLRRLNELLNLSRRDERLMRLIRDEKNPQRRAALRMKHRQVIDRIEVLEAQRNEPCDSK